MVTPPMTPHGRLHKDDYLRMIGVRSLPPLSSPFDSGYDPVTLEGHLDQNSHLMSLLKIPTSSWLVAKESATRRKIAVAKTYNVQAVTGGSPEIVPVQQGQFPTYLDLCADIGFTRIECGEDFKALNLQPRHVVRMANDRGLDVQFQPGERKAGMLTRSAVHELIEQARRWLDAGALRIVVPAEKNPRGGGLFDQGQNLSANLAENAAKAFGLRVVMFEAPDQATQRALIDHFGPEVYLCQIKLEELLAVEVYRRSAHTRVMDRSRDLARTSDAGSQ